MATTTTTRKPLLRTPIRIDSQIRTDDGQAGYDLDWGAPSLSTHAERIDMSGGESLVAMQVAANSMRRYRLRLPPSFTIDPTMRLVDLRTGETFNIRNTNEPDQMHRWVVLLCEFIPGSTGA